MRIHRLETVDGFIAFDLDDCPVSAGGTRFAPDVTEQEAAVLARAMTYKFAVLGGQMGGAKGAVRGDPEHRDELMRRYCEEIRPFVQSATFLTSSDLGTSASDFESLRDADAPRSLMTSFIGNVPIEDLVTGYGVVVAAEAAAGSIDGLTFAIEGFGKVGGGVAREAVRRGARVIAVSTIDGCVIDRSGLDVELMLSMRHVYGDGFVSQLGAEFDPDPAALFEVDADVLVPGARTGVITADVARRLKTRWVAPASNVPYTKDAIDVMRERRIRYLPDFLCNAGAVIGYTSDASSPGELFAHVDRRITKLMSEAAAWPGGPFEGACAMAERFIGSWRGRDGLPESPPLA